MMLYKYYILFKFQMKSLGSNFNFVEQKKYLLLGISTTLLVTIVIVVYTVGFQNIASNVTMNYVLSYIAYLIMTANRLTMTFLFMFFLLSVRRRFLQINNYLRSVRCPIISYVNNSAHHHVCNSIPGNLYQFDIHQESTNIIQHWKMRKTLQFWCV